MTRTNLLAVVVLAALVGCASQRTPQLVDVCSGAIEARGASYEGVIFPSHCGPLVIVALPDKVESYWQPTPENIATLEARLPRALELGRAAPNAINRYAAESPRRAAQVAEEIGTVLSRLPSYRRQYIGVAYRSGHRRILVNCFPSAIEGRPDGFSYWKQQWVAVEDGGTSYWHIQYDIVEDQFADFEANGVA